MLRGSWCVAALAAALTACGVPGQAAAQTSPVMVTGAEIESWFAADEMAVAGFGLSNNCHWMTKGPKAERTQTVYCPGAKPFTVVGEARLEGNKLCSKFVYPDGSRFDTCQEIFKVGENKYEGRAGGVHRTTFYRLLR